MKSVFFAVGLSLGLAASAAAQTANGSPTDPAPFGLAGGPRGVSRTAPTVGGPETFGLGDPDLGDPTPAERREDRKLDGYVHICKGC